MGYQEIPPKTRKQVVEMYQEGKRLQAISDETGLGRPSIYWVLESEGVRPNRTARAVPTEQGRLQDEVVALRALVAMLARLLVQYEAVPAEVQDLMRAHGVKVPAR